jgi:hypothetical protein
MEVFSAIMGVQLITPIATAINLDPVQLIRNCQLGQLGTRPADTSCGHEPLPGGVPGQAAERQRLSRAVPLYLILL